MDRIALNRESPAQFCERVGLERLVSLASHNEHQHWPVILERIDGHSLPEHLQLVSGHR